MQRLKNPLHAIACSVKPITYPLKLQAQSATVTVIRHRHGTASVPMPSEAPRRRALPAAIEDRRQTATDVYEHRPRPLARTHPRTHNSKNQASGAQGFRLHARTNTSTCARTHRHNEPSSSVRSESKGATRESERDRRIY